LPHCLTHSSDMPSSLPNRSAQNRLLLPSNMLTTSSSLSCYTRQPATRGRQAGPARAAQRVVYTEGALPARAACAAQMPRPQAAGPSAAPSPTPKAQPSS
jgi:hypothetical protein